MTVGTILASLLFAVLGAVCLLVQLILLPGNWLLVLLACIFQVWSLVATDGGAPLFSWWTIAAGLVLAFLGELAETAMGAAGAKATGARTRGMWGAIIGSVIGGIAGMVLFSFVPIIGSLLGGLGGAAAGAFLMELSYADRGPGRAAMAAVGAAVGRTAGLLMKLSIGVAIWVLFVVAALF